MPNAELLSACVVLCAISGRSAHLLYGLIHKSTHSISCFLRAILILPKADLRSAYVVVYVVLGHFASCLVVSFYLTGVLYPYCTKVLEYAQPGSATVFYTFTEGHDSSARIQHLEK